MRAGLARHGELLRSVIGARGGFVFSRRAELGHPELVPGSHDPSDADCSHTLQLPFDILLKSLSVVVGNIVKVSRRCRTGYALSNRCYFIWIQQLLIRVAAQIIAQS